ncbi:MAG: T9SS type A sorting domain-containing protein [bacterium]|nr:T9SS type A sorting domain-containing protein [bacterium]
MVYIKYFLVSILLGGLTVSYKSATNISNTPGCSASSLFSQHSVALDSRNRVHIVWIDDVDTTGYKSIELFSKNKAKSSATHLYYKRSTDGGTTFGDTVRLADSLGFWPTIATNNLDAVHIFYSKYENVGDNYCIYYTRSVDGGSIWKDTVLYKSDSIQGLGLVSMATSGNNTVHSIWTKLETDSTYDFVYTHSFNSGSGWSNPVEKLTTAGVTHTPPQMGLLCEPFPVISASGNLVHLVWQDSKNDSLGEIYYKRSTDSGKVWASDVRLTTDTDISILPSVASSGNSVYIGWLQCEKQDSVFSYYIRYSSNGGASWGTPVCLIPAVETLAVGGYGMGIPQINVRDNFVAVVYGVYQYDSLMGEPYPKIGVKYSKNSGLSWSSNIISTGGFASMYPSAAIDGSGYLHIVWSALSISMENPDVYYSKVSLNAVEESSNSDFGFRIGELKVNPNLVSKFANISYELPVKSSFSLKVYNVSGRAVRTIFSGEQCAGEHTVSIDTKGLSGGIYFVRLESNGHCINKRFIVLK